MRGGSLPKPPKVRRMATSHATLLRVIAVLWVIWGVVHVLAGVMTVSLPTPDAVAGIADALDREMLQAAVYPDAAGGIIKQHGWNLGWIGVTTTIGGWFIWRGSRTAIWVSALVGGMADLGYFVFIDIPGYVNFVPGTVMTIISGSAIVLSAWVWRNRGGDAA